MCMKTISVIDPQRQNPFYRVSDEMKTQSESFKN